MCETNLDKYEYTLMEDSLNTLKNIDTIKHPQELIDYAITLLRKSEKLKESNLSIAAQAFICENLIMAANQALDRAEKSAPINENTQEIIMNLMGKAHDLLQMLNDEINEEFESMLINLFHK